MNKLIVLVICAVTIIGCKSDPNSPGIEYMPDMYRSVPYDIYAKAQAFSFNDTTTALIPPANTVARGQESFDYPFENNTEGYELAGVHLLNPVQLNDLALDEGKRLYGNFCVHCHGKEGMGKGTVPENSDYPNPPAYSGPQLKELSEGKMYHTLTYGKNLMGSHASQLSPTERWTLIHYVTLLQNPENPKFKTKDAESTSVESENLTAQNTTNQE